MKKIISLSLFCLFFVTSYISAQQSFTVEIKGSGKPILLFPGFGCSGKMWDETGMQLAASMPSLAIVTKTYNEQYKNLPTVKIVYAEKAAHFVMYDQLTWFVEQLFKIVD
jgi:hypothetical protein